MKKNIYKHILLACSVLVLFSACRKVPDGDMSNEDPNAGTSYIGFTGSMESSTFFDPFTDEKTVTVFSLKKDAANPTDLKTAQTITVKALPGAVPDGYTLLPKEVYSLADNTASQAQDGSLTFNFAPGDFQKSFRIKINGSKLDLSETYILPYQITSTDGLAVHAASKDTLYAIYAVKNAYDGKYTLSGSITRNSATGPDTKLGGTYPDGLTIDLSTSGPNTNEFYALWIDGSGVGGIGGLHLDVDPVTHKVTVSSRDNPAVKNTPGEENSYDPATKTFILNFDWGTDPSTRIVKEKLVYKGSR
ncbi:BT_3987 domain-containing protein [Mucilaginibacter litoreus]|uniref:BT_3987 domain-containing protein n=1 Tax=Mucilaginibacter litoreus TaxID=1048221 RepID=A0ABW3AXE3_9SPHI